MISPSPLFMHPFPHEMFYPFLVEQNGASPKLGGIDKAVFVEVNGGKDPLCTFYQLGVLDPVEMGEGVLHVVPRPNYTQRHFQIVTFSL